MNKPTTAATKSTTPVRTASKKTLLWMQRLVWIYIYGGLLALVMGIFVARADIALARTMQGVGLFFVILGVVLIYVRSRLKETPST
jgi:glucan phosphoethanolaminetransferase (alkaline phosphatase superfamily)